MRLLLIVEDQEYQALLQHHVGCEWAQAQLVLRSPDVPGMLPPEFLAQGYDAVIVDQDWQGGQGLTWLRELAGRRGFAPILFLADRADSAAAREARLFGAFGVLNKSKFVHETLISVLAEASRTQLPCAGLTGASPRKPNSRAVSAPCASRVTAACAAWRVVRCRSCTWPRARRPVT